MVLAGTGHRPEKIGGYDVPNPISVELDGLIHQALDFLKPERVISGMALGFDQWLAEACIDLNIPFVAAVPFTSFDSVWPVRSREHLRYLLAHAYETVIVSQTSHYSPHLLQLRNEWMVDHADMVLALWNGTPGGTANCIGYALSRGTPVNYLQVSTDLWTRARAVEEVIVAQRRRRRQEAQTRVTPMPRGAAPPPNPLPPEVEAAAPKHADPDKINRRPFSVGRKIDMDD